MSPLERGILGQGMRRRGGGIGVRGGIKRRRCGAWMVHDGSAVIVTRHDWILALEVGRIVVITASTVGSSGRNIRSRHC